MFIKDNRTKLTISRALICVDAHSHAAHAIIFGRGTTFSNPVKKMLRKFAMLFKFQLVTRFVLKRFKKVVPSSRTRAALKFRTKNNVVCSPEFWAEWREPVSERQVQNSQLSVKNPFYPLKSHFTFLNELIERMHTIPCYTMPPKFK